MFVIVFVYRIYFYYSTRRDLNRAGVNLIKVEWKWGHLHLPEILLGKEGSLTVTFHGTAQAVAYAVETVGREVGSVHGLEWGVNV